jgi:hypothetical protein
METFSRGMTIQFALKLIWFELITPYSQSQRGMSEGENARLCGVLMPLTELSSALQTNISGYWRTPERHPCDVVNTHIITLPSADRPLFATQWPPSPPPPPQSGFQWSTEERKWMWRPMILSDCTSHVTNNIITTLGQCPAPTHRKSNILAI